ncbi:MAG: hypothetical protein ABIN36_01930 [Ferruginibacter sp.]
MKNFLFLATSCVTILLSACKKDDPAPTTAQRIQQIWTYEKTYGLNVEPGFPTVRDTTIGSSGDYVDFRTDNKAYSKVNGYFDTLSYSIISDSKMILDGDSATIQILNDNQFQILTGEFISSTDYYEATIYLKK